MSNNDKIILILEDDSERIVRFRKALGNGWTFYIWNNAYKMVEELEELLPTADIISLDHDLIFDIEDGVDPGDGVHVAKWLEEQTPVCPVIIHSSNEERVQWMMGSLDLGGWTYRNVLPFGDDWIESFWAECVKGLSEKG